MTPKKICAVGCIGSFWLLVIVTVVLLRPSTWEKESPDGQLMVRVTSPGLLGSLVWQVSTVLRRGSEEFPQQVIWKPDSRSFLYVYSAEPIAFL